MFDLHTPYMTYQIIHAHLIHTHRERFNVKFSTTYRNGYFIIGFPFLAILQLSEASNITVRHPSLV